jgi:hypothetical protein
VSTSESTNGSMKQIGMSMALATEENPEEFIDLRFVNLRSSFSLIIGEGEGS